MIAVSDAEESAKAHNRVRRVPGALVDHHVVYTAELLTDGFVDCRAIDLAGRDEATAGVGGINFSHRHSPKIPPPWVAPGGNDLLTHGSVSGCSSPQPTCRGALPGFYSSSRCRPPIAPAVEAINAPINI